MLCPYVSLCHTVCCRMTSLVKSKEEVRTDKKMELQLVCVKYSYRETDVKLESAWRMVNCEPNKHLPSNYYFRNMYVFYICTCDTILFAAMQHGSTPVPVWKLQQMLMNCCLWPYKMEKRHRVKIYATIIQ